MRRVVYGRMGKLSRRYRWAPEIIYIHRVRLCDRYTITGMSSFAPPRIPANIPFKYENRIHTAKSITLKESFFEDKKYFVNIHYMHITLRIIYDVELYIYARNSGKRSATGSIFFLVFSHSKTYTFLYGTHYVLQSSKIN